ncbi:MAG: nucleoside triphosphate pyrophosphatase [Nitrospirota bacterium]
MRLLLASTSPRRKDLLALLQVPFEIVEPVFEERVRQDVSPEEQACLIADGKARSCAERFPDRLVLGSDTLIAVGRTILGKPADRAGADRMLRQLRGREHLIHTAVALRGEAARIREWGVETVRVWMKDFTDGELDEYLRTGESLGKAGAYSIQGAGGRLIACIEGDFTAAVGLPLKLVAGLLTKHGMPVPVDVAQLYRAKPYPNWAVFQR